MRSCRQLDEHRVVVPVIHAPCPVPCCHLQAAGGTAGRAEEGQPRQPGHRGQPELFMETTRQPVRKGALLLRLGESQKPPSAGPDPARPASRKGLLSGAARCLGSPGTRRPGWGGEGGAGGGLGPSGCSGGLAVPAQEGCGSVCPAVQEQEGGLHLGLGTAWWPRSVPSCPFNPPEQPCLSWETCACGTSGVGKASPQPLDKTLHPRPSFQHESSSATRATAAPRAPFPTTATASCSRGCFFPARSRGKPKGDVPMVVPSGHRWAGWHLWAVRLPRGRLRRGAEGSALLVATSPRFVL